MKQNLTRAQYDKLTIDCETLYGGTWSNKRKFVRRGKRFVVVAFLDNGGHPLTVSYSVYNVKVDGKVLAYGETTNPKKPAPFEPMKQQETKQAALPEGFKPGEMRAYVNNHELIVNKEQTHIAKDGEAFEILEDQDGAKYFFDCGKAIYFDHITEKGNDILYWMAWGQTISVTNYANIQALINASGNSNAGIPSPEDKEAAKELCKRYNAFHELVEALRELVYVVGHTYAGKPSLLKAQSILDKI